MPVAKYSREEVAERGEAICEQHIRTNVESESKGKYLVLDKIEFNMRGGVAWAAIIAVAEGNRPSIQARRAVTALAGGVNRRSRIVYASEA